MAVPTEGIKSVGWGANSAIHFKELKAQQTTNTEDILHGIDLTYTVFLGFHDKSVSKFNNIDNNVMLERIN